MTIIGRPFETGLMPVHPQVCRHADRTVSILLMRRQNPDWSWRVTGLSNERRRIMKEITTWRATAR